MSKPVILTGLRANNDLHIGNYFGAMLPMIDMAEQKSDEYQINMFVPDLHSFTTPIDHSQLLEQTMHNIRLYAAAGLPLDNPNIHIYRQSYIPAHSELTWILDCFTGFGEMSRMTQFKDKRDVIKVNAFSDAVERGDDNKLSDDDFNKTIVNDYQARVSVGLFNYPVLMASDILLYNSTYVPVGDDQTQHLEFARDIAERMNSRFGELFVVPKPVKEQHEFFGKDQGLRIKDLTDPTKKMSKSDETGKGVIFLGDEPTVAAKKIMSAETDSVGSIHFDYDKQPGISNLLQILALLTSEPLDKVIREWEGKTSYGELKQTVAEEMVGFLANLQGKLASVDEGTLQEKLTQSEEEMNKSANATLLKVQKAVGLRP